jgi:hypothetical protein
MIGRALIATAVVVAFTSPAGAFHCPKNVKAINAAIGNSNLSAGDKAKVKSLSDEGFAQHKAGDHRASVKTLAEAMRMLVGGIK